MKLELKNNNTRQRRIYTTRNSTSQCVQILIMSWWTMMMSRRNENKAKTYFISFLQNVSPDFSLSKDYIWYNHIRETICNLIWLRAALSFFLHHINAGCYIELIVFIVIVKVAVVNHVKLPSFFLWRCLYIIPYV